MDTIELHRRFHVWDKDSASEPVYWWPGYADHLLAWSDLRKRRRVVVLAEAGSGKSVELERQAQILTAQGEFAFYATLEDVARAGLDNALGAADRTRLGDWRKEDAPGWFFIDSIDEAKHEKIRLDYALRQIADGIAGREHRAFIVLSGRHTEWEFERDGQRLLDVLPIPEPGPPAPPELRTLVRRILRHEKPPAPPEKEAPLIVLMAPLQDEQMRLYASSRGVDNVEAFLEAVAAANLLDTASRPLDLDWLVRYWRTHGRLGTFAQMVAESLRERLQETDTHRSRHDPLSADKAMRGLERLGAALVFGRKKTIAVPDSGARANPAAEALEIGASCRTGQQVSAWPSWVGPCLTQRLMAGLAFTTITRAW